MTGRVIDLGAGQDPDPRATETVDLFADADHEFDLSAEWELPDDYADGLVANHVVEHLDADHVFEEAGRVLREGGWFELTVPLGENADTDNDHVTRWTFGTPATYCRKLSEKDGRHWDTDTPFVMESRDVDVWLGGPFKPLTPLFKVAAWNWPGWAAHRCFAGELTARYRRAEP